MTDSLFVLKTDFDMVTYDLKDKTEFLAQNIMRLILDGEKTRQRLCAIETRLDGVEALLAEHSRILAEHSQELKLIKADINKMDAKLDLIIKHLKV